MAFSNQGVFKMDLKADMERWIAQAQARGDDHLVRMLEDRLEQLERPVSAEALFRSAPISNRRGE